MLTIKDKLLAARAVIDTPDKWTKGAFGRTKTDTIIDIHEVFACRFCIVGALLRTGGEDDASDCEAELEAFLPPLTEEEKYFTEPVFKFNDDPRTTHADVLALFDKAIEKCKQ